METPTKLPYVTRATGVHAHLEGLGLQTLNDSSAGVKNRAIFTFQPVIRLYKLKIPALFGVLLRDEAILDRDDPKLFDDELETLLREFGPFVWSVPGEGSRDHLRTAQTGTLYVTDIIYPRDAAILKDRLRGLILSKRSNHGTDIQALIDKTHHDARLKVLGTTSKSTSATRLKSGRATNSARPRSTTQKDAHRQSFFGQRHEGSDSDTEGSVIGTTTRRRAFLEGSSLHTGFSIVELRLYRKTSMTFPGAYGPVVPYGSMFLTPDCITSRDCFNRICDKIQTDCSFIVLQLPADMEGQSGGLRLDRGASDSETIFQRVLEIFRKAKKFPGEPQYRSVEVEVGLDMS